MFITSDATMYDQEVNLDSTPISYQSLIQFFKKGAIIQPVYRVWLLDDLEIPVRDISADVTSFDMNITYQTGQRRSLNLSLINKDGKYTPKYGNLIQIGSSFRFDIGFIINKTIYWKQMGIFLLKEPNRSREASGGSLGLSLCDKFGLFDGTISGKTGLRDIIPDGVSMYESFVTIITADMGNGKPYDMKPIIFNSKRRNQETFYTIKQDAGNLLSTLLTDMAGTISSDVYYNEFGNMVVESNVNEFLNANLPIVWQFNEGDKDVLNLSISEKSGDIVNTVIVKGNIVNAYQFHGQAENNNPLSPTCVQYRGNMYDIVSDTAYFSDEMCQDKAMYELINHTRGVRTINISCPPLPIFDVNKAVTVYYPSEDIKNDIYVIDSISISGNGMTLGLSNMNEVVF